MKNNILRLIFLAHTARSRISDLQHEELIKHGFFHKPESRYFKNLVKCQQQLDLLIARIYAILVKRYGFPS